MTRPPPALRLPLHRYESDSLIGAVVFFQTCSLCDFNVICTFLFFLSLLLRLLAAGFVLLRGGGRRRGGGGSGGLGFGFLSLLLR